MKDSLNIQGLITLELLDKDGNLKYKKTLHNLITSAGKAQIALLAGTASAVPFTYLSLGTGSVAAAITDTALGAETAVSGLARALATISQVTTTTTNDTLQLYKSFTAGGSASITEVGIFNDPTTGTILGRRVFTAVNMTATDILNITYQVIFA